MVVKIKSFIDKFAEEICNAHFSLSENVIKLVENNLKKETDKNAIKVLEMILENNKIAKEERIPLCQDTGVAIFFIEKSYNIQTDIPLQRFADIVTQKAYTSCYLRKSIVKSPLERVNTKTNTPAVVHIEEKEEENIFNIYFLAKGAGSENKSAVYMLNPTSSENDIINVVKETVKKAGGSACPPLFIGIGIGSTMDGAAILSKKALLKMFDDNENNDLEEKIVEEVNTLNIGPMGYGGKTTALKVKIETYPCHIASMPIAITLQCHSFRYFKAKIEVKDEKTAITFTR